MNNQKFTSQLNKMGLTYNRPIIGNEYNILLNGRFIISVKTNYINYPGCISLIKDRIQEDIDLHE